jgi:DNA-directed RNA polymerase subunit RPC12/RpoP
MYSGTLMLDQDIYCPECGTKLKQGEINRLNSGIDIACEICGTEILGKEVPDLPAKSEETRDTDSDDIGEKIKTGIKTFVKKIKEFAEELDGNSKKKPANDYSQEY